MSTQGPEERNRLPDLNKWRLTSSDRGVLLMHEIWEEQIERVQEGLDPIGIVRGPQAEQMMPMMGEVAYVPWEEGMRRFNQSGEERIGAQVEELTRLGYR